MVLGVWPLHRIKIKSKSKNDQNTNKKENIMHDYLLQENICKALEEEGKNRPECNQACQTWTIREVTFSLKDDTSIDYRIA